MVMAWTDSNDKALKHSARKNSFNWNKVKDEINGSSVEECRKRYNIIAKLKRKKNSISIKATTTTTTNAIEQGHLTTTATTNDTSSTNSPESKPVEIEWSMSMDKKLRKLVHHHCFDWKTIGSILSLSPVACRMRYKIVSKQRQSKTIKSVSTHSSNINKTPANDKVTRSGTTTNTSSSSSNNISIKPSGFSVFTHSLKTEIHSLYQNISLHLPSTDEISDNEEDTSSDSEDDGEFHVEEMKSSKITKPTSLPIRRAGVDGSEFKKRNLEQMLKLAKEKEVKDAEEREIESEKIKEIETYKSKNPDWRLELEEDRIERKNAFIKSCKADSVESPISSLFKKIEKTNSDFKSSNEVLFQRAFDALGGLSDSMSVRDILIPSSPNKEARVQSMKRNKDEIDKMNKSMEMLDSILDEDDEDQAIRIRRCVLDASMEALIPEWLVKGKHPPSMDHDEDDESSSSYGYILPILELEFDDATLDDFLSGSESHEVDSLGEKSELAEVLDILEKEAALSKSKVRKVRHKSKSKTEEPLTSTGTVETIHVNESNSIPSLPVASSSSSSSYPARESGDADIMLKKENAIIKTVDISFDDDDEDGGWTSARKTVKGVSASVKLSV